MSDYGRESIRSVGKRKAETAALLAEERRAKRVWDECRAEIDKLQRYAEKSVLAGDDGGARKFLEQKLELEQREPRLKAAYEKALAGAAPVQQAGGSGAGPHAAAPSQEQDGGRTMSAQERWEAIKAKRDRQQ